MVAGRKISGGKYHKQRKKKKYELPGQPRVVKLAETKTKVMKTRGGNLKMVSISQNVANVIHDGKSQKVKITNVVETPSNRFLARQNVLVKGAIIDTEIGKAKITNRPSQEGIVNAMLLDNQE
jgi:small subunit ribosomal protein S8e